MTHDETRATVRYFGVYLVGDDWLNGPVSFIERTYDRKEIFDKAKKIANEIGSVVTITEEHFLGGEPLKFYYVYPD